MSQNKPYDPNQKMLGKDKLSRIPVKVERLNEPLPKPDWLRIRLSHSDRVQELKQKLRENQLFTVCEEASCPNLNECFGKGTATFMIMGDKCTRRCSFCDVGHGRPDPLDPNEPQHLGETVASMGLKYVVITSVDRDDLRDGGASHFTACVQAVREKNSGIQIEVLVPDFRGRMEKALNAMEGGLPDVFNHNIETVPRLYKQARPGSDYHWSLDLLRQFQKRFPGIPTKSGIMVGLGETDEEIREVLSDLRAHGVNMVTIGQYLQPTAYHMPVMRYMPPEEFLALGNYAKSIGFSQVASGPLVRSSYHADKQAAGEDVR
jgi:lipoic acid synthetase